MKGNFSLSFPTDLPRFLLIARQSDKKPRVGNEEFDPILREIRLQEWEIFSKLANKLTATAEQCKLDKNSCQDWSLKGLKETD